MSFVLPPAFAGLDPDSQSQARSLLQPFSMQADEVVMEEGEEDISLAFIAKGAVALEIKGTRVGVAGVRDMIGEMELFTGLPRLATARATTPVDLLVLGPDQYIELCETGNPVVFQLEQASLRRVGDRLRAMDDAIRDLTSGQPYELHPQREGLLARLNPFKKQSHPEFDVTEVLASSPLFQWASASILDELGANFSQRSFRNDQTICAQGEPGETMFVLAEGQVDVILQITPSHAERIATLEPGMAFGDGAILHGCPRSATCIAKGNVSALMMDRKQFLILVEGMDPVASVFRQALIRNLVNHVIKAGERLIDISKVHQQSEEQLYRGTPVSAVWRD